MLPVCVLKPPYAAKLTPFTPALGSKRGKIMKRAVSNIGSAAMINWMDNLPAAKAVSPMGAKKLQELSMIKPIARQLRNRRPVSCESLESRQLLSASIGVASLDGGILTVEGTRHDDVISL